MNLSFKTLLILVPLVLFSFTLKDTTPATLPFVEGSWSDVVAKAKQQNKPVFAFVFSNTCGVCKKTKAQVFTDPEVIAYLSANFVCAKVDTEEMKNSLRLTTWNVEGTPTFVFLDNNRRMLHKAQGWHDGADLIEEAKTALTK